MFRRLLSLLLFAFATCAFAQTPTFTDYTDVWSNPAESGWGVNMVQSNDFIFMTFFIHDFNRQPTWVTAQVSRNNAGDFTGNVYRTTAPWYGASFNPNLVNTVPVGTASLQPINSYQASLNYSIDGVFVSKTIQRLTLTPILLGGDYLGGTTGSTSQCNQASMNSTFTQLAQFRVTQTPAPSSGLKIEFNPTSGFACTMQGTYMQNGQTFRIGNASYVCSSGLNTTATVTEIKATAQGFEGTWTATTLNGCRESGRFAGVLQ